jgi:hypothetical protein
MVAGSGLPTREVAFIDGRALGTILTLVSSMRLARIGILEAWHLENAIADTEILKFRMRRALGIWHCVVVEA